jgi:hypothetical protein
VLDVGFDRIAIPLTEYLTSRYEGFDISPAAIAWVSGKHRLALPELPLHCRGHR